MPREIVLDTNVLVAAFRSKRGASYELVRSIGRAGWRLNVSVALALEYEDVLKRDGMCPGLAGAEIDGFLDYVSERPISCRLCFAVAQVCEIRMTSVF